MGFLDNLIYSGMNWTKAHSSQLLTVGITSGVVLTGVLSFKAGTKAGMILREKKKDWEDTEPDDKETKKEIVIETIKELAPKVIPPLIIGGLTIFGVWRSYSISTSKIATLTSIAGITSKQIKDIHDELNETYGEKKAKQIRDRAMQRRYSSEHPNDGEECKYLIDCGGSVMCCDIYGDVYFMSDHESVKQAIEWLGYQCAEEGSVCLNDLYSKLGIPPKNWADGVTWTYRDLRYETNNFGVPIPKLPIDTTTVLGFNDRPCLGIRYDISY